MCYPSKLALQDGNVKAGPAFCLRIYGHGSVVSLCWCCNMAMLKLVLPFVGRIYGVQVGYFYGPFLPHTIEGVLR